MKLLWFWLEIASFCKLAICFINFSFSVLYSELSNLLN